MTDTTIIAKTFDPAEIEPRLYAHWEATGAFRPDRPDAQPFTIVIPPPNVTGSLHIGHALDNTLQDVLIRYHRLKGRDALWVVGTDHAGIATQMVVERTIAAQGLKRSDMSRDAFLDHVWEWKEQSGGTITRQLRRLGASCDWAHERFTMDAGFSAAVTKVFVDLYNEGLLYRAKRLVNWDPKLGTAISDLEVEYREIDGSLWHFRYPFADGSGYLIVATTRPETILGDGAVAVNPDDDRYRHLVGQFVRLPLVDRLIPIIADSYVEADFGSGAVKITAAHDFNDFAVAGRHPEAGIPLINLMNPDGTMSDACPPAYRGLSREAARKQVVADFDALGLLDHVEPHRHQVPYGDRSGVVIEPFLTDQWYVDAATLAAPAIEAVRSGATRFVPATWEKTYFNWMENIQPWCVSRQITWGHRIPAWYGPAVIDKKITLSLGLGSSSSSLIDVQTFVGLDENAVAEAAAAYYGGSHLLGVIHFAEGAEEALRKNLDAFQKGEQRVYLFREDDVLDTWFSSALWPFGTLGWPEQTTELARYYPGDVLVTGFDIIFFWVARMMMQGIHFMGEVPFATVYCHGLVRDAKGAKMSKSRGNTVDPLALIDRYGADALRFTLTAMESQGRDIKLDERRVEGYRNFATKLWNAARFAQSNGIGGSRSAEPPTAQAPVNRWIIGEVVATARALDAAVVAFRFDTYAETIYAFVWNRFCDWYLELTKPLLAEGADAAVAAETRAVAGWALDQILVLLHPVMPFLTEELWGKLAPRDHDLIIAAWPVTGPALIDTEAAADIDWLIELIGGIRAQRLETGFNPADKIPVCPTGATQAQVDRLNRNVVAIERIARIQPAKIDMSTKGETTSWGVEIVPRFEIVRDIEKTSFVTAQFLAGGMTLVAFTQGFIDLAAERARLEKNAASAEKERDALAGRLAAPGFVERAKPEAVDKARADHAARAAEAERLRAALARLG